MVWEELTGDEFSNSVNKANGVCLLPLSCIERHAHHLPLGTDMYIARDICSRAAKVEPAIIFPDIIFTQILEARHCLGTIAIEPDLILRLLENVCNEIARNGFTKIILVNSHGGNVHLLQFFCQMQLASPRKYMLYLPKQTVLPQDKNEIKQQWESLIDGHAGESETSQMLLIKPELVNSNSIFNDKEGMPQQRLENINKLKLYTGIWWYADHPTHYCGDAVSSNISKGEKILTAKANALIEIIKAVKNDDIGPQLLQEFFEFSNAPQSFNRS